MIQCSQQRDISPLNSRRGKRRRRVPLHTLLLIFITAVCLSGQCSASPTNEVHRQKNNNNHHHHLLKNSFTGEIKGRHHQKLLHSPNSVVDVKGEKNKGRHHHVHAYREEGGSSTPIRSVGSDFGPNDKVLEAIKAFRSNVAEEHKESVEFKDDQTEERFNSVQYVNPFRSFVSNHSISAKESPVVRVDESKRVKSGVVDLEEEVDEEEDDEDDDYYDDEEAEEQDDDGLEEVVDNRVSELNGEQNRGRRGNNNQHHLHKKHIKYPTIATTTTTTSTTTTTARPQPRQNNERSRSLTASSSYSPQWRHHPVRHQHNQHHQRHHQPQKQLHIHGDKHHRTVLQNSDEYTDDELQADDYQSVGTGERHQQQQQPQPQQRQNNGLLHGQYYRHTTNGGPQNHPPKQHRITHRGSASGQSQAQVSGLSSQVFSWRMRKWKLLGYSG